MYIKAMKWIIFFCCAVGNGNVTDGNVAITKDSVRIFNHHWEIVKESKPIHMSYHEGFAYINLQMQTIVGKDTIRGYVHINGEIMMVNIPKLSRVVTMKQENIKP